jgi:hypothetical protein
MAAAAAAADNGQQQSFFWFISWNDGDFLFLLQMVGIPT